MNTVKKRIEEPLTQFEITSDLLRNLYKFDLTPATKLVLLELTTHLNERKNGFVVFPSVGYIAEVLGIGLTAVKKAISDLIKEGIIIKTKRGNVKGNYNKYVFTQKVRNMTSKRSENDFFKRSDSDRFLHEQKKVTKKEQRGKFLLGGNVYWASEQSARAERRHIYCERSLTEDEQILRDYARKHGARNIDAYVASLKKSKSAENIINEKQKIVRRAVATLLESKKQIEIYEGFRGTGTAPETCTAWVELGKKLGIKK